MQARARPLFRRKAVRRAGQQLFGGVSVVIPPSGRLALCIASTAMIALVVATTIVEVPLRTRAIGVLMPAGGLVDVVARHPGQVKGVFVTVGRLVAANSILVTTGDAAYLRGESASAAHLNSLESELDLMNAAFGNQREIAANRMSGLENQESSAGEQLVIAKVQQESLGRELEVLERRMLRWHDLAGEGHVSQDALEREQAAVFRMRAEVAGFQATSHTLTRQIRQLALQRDEARRQAELDRIQHDIGVARLRREIEASRHALLQEYRMTRQYVVAQVLVQAGDTVQAGQVLARLRRPGDRLQAWLYLSTSRARHLRRGQSVEITLDAYPRQVYGTVTATVSNIPDIALVPQDIQAPLLLKSPVFEVKAELDLARDARQAWQLSPGASFSADIIQQRLRLYEWLINSWSGGRADAIG